MSKISLTPNASGTGNFTIASPNSNTDRTLTLPDNTTTFVGTDATQTLTNKTLTSPVIAGTPTGVGVLTSGTAVASTSGTSIDFTSIPSWVKRITVMFQGISTNGSSVVQVQLGDSGGIENTDYLGATGSTGGTTQFSAGFLIMGSASAAYVVNQGALTLTNISGNTWACFGILGRSDSNQISSIGGTKTLSDVLTQLRITTVNGTDTFDAGSINILYE